MGNIHRYDTSHRTYAKSADCTELLTWSYIALSDLSQGCIASESDSRVGALPQSSRHEALEKATNAFLLRNDSCAVQKPAHARHGRFAVVDAEHSSQMSAQNRYTSLRAMAYSCVLILSNGVTASKDSVMPVPMPASTVLGPEILPSASLR